MSPPRTPDWVSREARSEEAGEPSDLLDRAIAIACESARRQHGPFGSIVADHEGRVVAAGHNRVVATHDSTAHAEIQAIRAAERELGDHDLGDPRHAPLTLYASCEPCVMCFGAIYWSGLHRVVSAAPADAAERLGFQEGPVTDAMWTAAREDKGIERADVEPSRDPREPFRIYDEEGGQIY